MIMQMKAVAGDEMAWNRLLFKPVILNSSLFKTTAVVLKQPIRYKCYL